MEFDLKFSQLEMVTMQMDRACRLFYAEGDFVSALALASRSVDVLEKMLEKKKVKTQTLYKLVKSGPNAKKLWDKMREAEIAGKHWSPNQRRRIAVNPGQIEMLIFNGVHLLNELGGPLPIAVRGVKSFVFPRIVELAPKNMTPEEKAGVLKKMADAGINPKDWTLKKFVAAMKAQPPSYAWGSAKPARARRVGRHHQSR